MFWCLKGYRYQILSFNLSFIGSGWEGLVRTIIVASPEYLHPQITFGLVLHSTWPNKIHYMYNIPVFDGICRHEWLSLSLSRKIYNHIYIYLFVDSHHFTTKSSLQSTSPLRSTRIRGTARLQDLKIASDQWKFVDLVHWVASLVKVPLPAITKIGMVFGASSWLIWLIRFLRFL